MRMFIMSGALACSMAMIGSANAQKVYKCTVSGVVTYSQHECGSDAKEIMDIPKGTPRPAAHDDALQAISNSVEDADCRRSAKRLHDEYSEQRIADAQDQITHL